MSTPTQLMTDLAAVIEAAIAGATRLASDYRTDLASITPGATVYQLRGGPAGKNSESNASATLQNLELELSHYLNGAERSYTEGALQTTLEALIAPSFWRDTTHVLDVVEDPGYAVVRNGNVVTATVTVVVSIVP